VMRLVTVDICYIIRRCIFNTFRPNYKSSIFKGIQNGGFNSSLV